MLYILLIVLFILVCAFPLVIMPLDFVIVVVFVVIAVKKKKVTGIGLF